ncbi:MAG: hypothetical protein MUC48_23525 [Leptolyngbya sp. Prado105]|jgi:hypothetical protein|nr:hypothetical protein [Leptolyngbya sp. Prado105]
MRFSFYWLVGFSILVSPYFWGDAAFAEGNVKAQTSQMTVTGIRCVIPQPLCIEPTELSRTVILQSTQTGSATQASETVKEKPAETRVIQAFRLVPTDLERKDNASVIPARWVTAQINDKTQLIPQKFLSLPVQFDLKQVPRSGEYIGTLFIEHSEGNVAIPVMIKIKDSWQFAVPLLAIGVALALLLAAYQAEGFDRDDITIRVGQLRSQMRTEVGDTTVEARTARIFQSKVEAYLVDVGTALETKNWVEARKSFTDAQASWNRWRKQRSAWIDLYEYVEEALVVHLGNEISEDSVYGRDLKSELNRIKREMANCETPQQYSELLKPLKEKIQQFLNAGLEYQRLNELRNQMGSDGDQWQSALVDLDNRLNRIALDDGAGLKAWQDEAEKLKQHMQDSQKGMLDSRNIIQFVPASIRSIPNASKGKEQIAVQQASWRIKAYQYVGHGVSIVLLSWVGFNQLYASNPIFGANAIADYSSLLAWGFTAEVTRDSVAKVLQRFKLPGG